MHAGRFVKGVALALGLMATGCATTKSATGEPSATGAAKQTELMKVGRGALKKSLAALTPADRAAAQKLGWTPEKAATLEAKPIYRMTESEVNDYLGYVALAEPELPARVVRIARHNLGQPYEMYLLGEYPFETFDPQPLYNLRKSDCVVFSEHTYAMALAKDWPSFFAMLQRIRYKDGQIGVVTRNHYTEADWNRNNSWLVRDVTEEVAGAKATAFRVAVDRTKFLRSRYKLESDIPKVAFTDYYVPYESVAEVEALLQPGDFVNVIRTKGGGCWAGHTGIITRGADGTVNFLHSTPPVVREQPLQEYIAQHRARDAKKPDGPQLAGFKFLRLEKDPIANLRAIDGPEAPRVSAPKATLDPAVKPAAAAP